MTPIRYRSFLAVGLVAAALAAPGLDAQTSYPMVMSLHPVAAQSGQASEHVLKSRGSMSGAFAVLVSGTGVTGEAIVPEIKPGESPPNLQEIKLRFSVSAEAAPGVRDFRIATPQGASTVGQLVIVRQPVAAEGNENDTLEKAQPLSIPAAACGKIDKNEDVDFYKFHAEAGQALSFHVRSMRLQDRIHDLQNHIDPIMSIRTGQGTTLASNDNHFFGDPFVHHRFEQAGDYFLEIRDVRYQGNQYWEYCVEITNEPFVANVYPLTVARGHATRLEFVGFPSASEATAIVCVPAQNPCGSAEWSLLKDRGATNPVPLLVTDDPVILEQHSENNQPANSQHVSLPAILAGRIETEGDVDCYAFAARKGESYAFEVRARREGSELDSHIRILDEQRRQLVTSDDMRWGKRSYSDSWIENWTAPADGLFVLEIRDLHTRGGPGFVYAIAASRAKPCFQLWLDTDKTQLTPGTSGVVFVRAERKNGFAGEIQLSIDGLPPGVEASCGRILAQGDDGCILLTADHDAQLVASNIVVRGTSTQTLPDGEVLTLAASAHTFQEIYQPGGGRGHWPVEMHTVCVGQRMDLWAVTLDTYDITLKPGETRKIAVTIDRAPGFDKNVTLDVTYNHLGSIYGNPLPKGVKLELKESKTLLTGKESAGSITLSAAKDAVPAEKQQVTVMANVSLNFVMKSTYCSQPLLVTVAAP